MKTWIYEQDDLVFSYGDNIRPSEITPHKIEFDLWGWVDVIGDIENPLFEAYIPTKLNNQPSELFLGAFRNVLEAFEAVQNYQEKAEVSK